MSTQRLMLSGVTKTVYAFATHRVAKNFGALAAMQGMSYLLSLVTFPYIVRVVGIETYGRLAFATAAIAYFVVLSDYGFTLSAAKEIAENAEDLQKTAEIFSSVMAIKLLLMVAAFVVLTLLIMTVGMFRQDAALLYIGFGVVLGSVLMPTWFFQGMQQMGYITLLDITAKTTSCGLLFFFVRHPGDYLLIPTFASLSLIASGLVALVLVTKRFKIAIIVPTKTQLIHHLYSGWHIFTTRIFLSLYTTANIVLLGFFTNPAVVGQYAVAVKIVDVGNTLFGAANQSLYPHLATAWKRGSGFYSLIRMASYMTVLTATVLAVAVFTFSDSIIKIVAGRSDSTIALLLPMLLVGLIVSPLGSLFSNALIVTGQAPQLQAVMLRTAILNILLAVPSILLAGAAGLVLTTVLTTFYVILACRRAIFQHAQ